MNDPRTSVANVVLLLAGAGALGLAGMWVRRRLERVRWRFAVDAFVVAAFVLALAGVAAEFAVLAIFDVPVVVTRSQYAEYRPGWFAPAPNQRWEAPAQPSLRSYEVRINEDGLRTDLPRPPAVVPADERRILFLGDAWTFGLGLDLPESYPGQVEAQLRAQDPDHRWVVFNAGIPGANVLTVVEWFARIAAQYRPNVAVFTVGEAADILPDLNTRLRQRERYAGGYLTRFALYLALFRYLDGRAVEDRILAGGLPEEREEQPPRLAESAALLGETARRLGCAVIFNRIVLRSPTNEVVGAAPEPSSLLRPYAETGARFVVTVWDPQGGALTDPNDGHPTIAGAQLLANAVIPSVRDIAAPWR